MEPDALLAEKEGSLSAQPIVDQKLCQLFAHRGQGRRNESLERGQRAVQQTSPFDLTTYLNAGLTSFLNLGKFADARLKFLWSGFSDRLQAELQSSLTWT